MGRDDVALSFLPLAHVYERLTDYCYLFRGIPVAYVAQPEDVPQAMVEVRPTLVAAVPRFFEKLYGTVMERGSQTTGLRRRLFDWAIAVARRAVPWKRLRAARFRVDAMLQWALADRLVYKKFRAGVGGRIRAIHFRRRAAGAGTGRVFYHGGHAAVSQGYGLTETSPVISTNLCAESHWHRGAADSRRGSAHRRGWRDVGARAVRDDGLLQEAGGDGAVISPDGWFATGDIGHLDADGYLTITDRKKELLKTAGGKLVAPAPIENALKTSPYILNAALVGDRRRFIAALIVPNRLAVEARAREAGVTLAAPAEMAASPWVHELIEGEITRLTANLAQYETIKRFALLDRDFTFDGGELTYTLKLKRRVIDQHYAEAIERLYAEPSPARQAPSESLQ